MNLEKQQEPLYDIKMDMCKFSVKNSMDLIVSITTKLIMKSLNTAVIKCPMKKVSLPKIY